MNNIIVLDSYFNLPNKSNLTDRLSCDYLIIWQWFTFFLGHPVYVSVSSALSGLVCYTQSFYNLLGWGVKLYSLTN